MAKHFIGYDGDISDGVNFGIGVFCSIMLLLGLVGGPIVLAVLVADSLIRGLV
jgi:hypothetical protein